MSVEFRLWKMPKLSIRALATPIAIGDVFIFLSLLLFIRFWVNPSILYCYPPFCQQDPIETYAPWHIVGTPPYPGELANTLCSFLIPWCADAWLGAVIFTGIALFLRLLTGRILANLGTRNIALLSYAPVAVIPLLLIYLVNPFQQSIAGIIGLLFAWIYQEFGNHNSWKRAVIFVVSAAAVFECAVTAFAAFALMCLVFEASVKRHPRAALAVVAAASVCVPPCMVGLFHPVYPAMDAYRLLLPALPALWSFPDLLPLAFWSVAPGIAIAAVFNRRIGKMLDALPLIKKAWPASRAWASLVRGMLLSASIGLLLVVVSRLNFPAFLRTRQAAAMNYAMLSRNWDGVLAAGRKIPGRLLTPPIVHLMDRALYGKGRLLEDLFTIPQNETSLLPYPYLKSPSRPDRLWDYVWGSRTWFDLGVINIAEHCALEAVSQNYYPPGLQLLAKIYLVKDMPEAARTCLMALRKDRGYETWARSYLDSLNAAGSNSACTPELREVRSVALQKEFILTGVLPLEPLIKENPKNRMAFEYFIAQNLIERNIDTLVRYVGLLRELHYPKIPRLFEEALLLGGAFEDGKAVLGGYGLSGESAASFERFSSILYDKHGGRSGEACTDLAESCGDSFYFYYVYGYSKSIVTNTK
jgi:hypothetical protein